MRDRERGQLEATLSALRPHLKLRAAPERGVSEWSRYFVRSRPAPQEQRAVVVSEEGRGLWDALWGTVQQTEGARFRWGDRSLQSMLVEVLASVASGGSVRAATNTLATELARVPRPRTVVFPIFGLTVDAPVEVCGLSFRAFDPDKLATDVANSHSVDVLWAELNATEFGSAVVVARLATDHERAGTIVLARLAVATPVLHLTRPLEAFIWYFDASIETTPYAATASGGPRAV